MTYPEPDYTERCKVEDLPGSNYLLRSTDDTNSPWKLVTGKAYEAYRVDGTDATLTAYSVTFDDGTTRLLDFDSDVEIGRPPDA